MATCALQRLVLETDRGRQLREHRETLLGEPSPFRVAHLIIRLFVEALDRRVERGELRLQRREPRARWAAMAVRLRLGWRGRRAPSLLRDQLLEKLLALRQHGPLPARACLGLLELAKPGIEDAQAKKDA